ncbi:tetratricopeptide repeat protein [Deinococcus sonorensis]|uniref:Tetratricopeptide repeat protein n=2 Tax=Deinococcus sonorensis TaxID=309891 RepID=A0AAU7UCL1_9DEIO
MQPPFGSLPPSDPDQPSAQALLHAGRALLSTTPRRALDMAQEALSVATAQADRAGQAHAHLLCGQTLHRLADLQQAEAQLSAAADLFALLKDPAQEAQALVDRGRVLRELGEPQQAAEVLERALHFSEQLNDRALKATILNHQAALAQMSGHAELALRQLEDALSIRRELGDRLGAAQCLNNIGQVRLSRHDLPAALQTLTEAYELLKSADDATTSAHCLVNIGYVYEEMGDHQLSYDAHARALQMARGHGNHTLELYCLNNLAEAVSSLQRHQEAAELFAEALQIAERIGMRSLSGSAHHGLGRAATALGRPAEALPQHRRALEIATELGEPQGEVDALLGLGEALLALQRPAEAREALERALPLAVQGELQTQVARLRALIAQAAQATGDLAVAVQQLWALRALEQGLFREERERQTRQLTVQFDVERAHHEAAVSNLQTEIAQRAYQEAEAKVGEQTRRLARTQVEVVTRLANAAEYRDDVTGEHTLRVGQVSALLARRLGLGSEEVALLRVAARLHDVGKIGISDLVLQKPARLTLEEFELMKRHTLIGGEILMGGESPLLQMAEQIALSHHEHWDGGGYPYRLSGEQIPLLGRIVAVADVYDALLHPRPYKRAWTLDAVLAELQRQRGRQFQPEVVDALLALHRSGELPLSAVVDDDQPVQDVLIRRSALNDVAPVEPLPGYPGTPQWRLHDLEHRYRQAVQTIDTLHTAAFTDALTGLANRRAFEDELETELVRAARHGTTLSVVSMDLDGLKTVNDRDGHERGDALLRQVALALRTHLGATGRVYRIGGDEFAVVLPDLGPAQHPAVLQELEQVVQRLQVQGFASASVSAGIAAFPDEATVEGDLLRLSDQRMYARKLARRQDRLATRVP